MKKIFEQNGLLVLFAVVLTPSLVYAHTGVGHTSGFMYGLGHPIGGIDHILAMTAVGIWAAQTGGRSVWAIPLTFVSIMTLGSVLGMIGFALPFVEQGIVMSVLIFGVLITAAAHLPLVLSAIIVGLFAVFHGHAHGTEITADLSGISYSTGFILATSLLHLSGIGIPVLLKSFGRLQFARYAGGVITAGGIYLVFA